MARGRISCRLSHKKNLPSVTNCGRRYTQGRAFCLAWRQYGFLTRSLFDSLSPCGRGVGGGVILFLSSRLRRRIYLRFPAPRAGFFLLSGQEKETKEKAARMARLPHCASRRNRRSPQLAGHEIRASGSNTRLAAPDSGCDARARHTGWVSKTFSGFVNPAEANTALCMCCYTVTLQFNMNNP